MHFQQSAYPACMRRVLAQEYAFALGVQGNADQLVEAVLECLALLR